MARSRDEALGMRRGEDGISDSGGRGTPGKGPGEGSGMVPGPRHLIWPGQGSG